MNGPVSAPRRPIAATRGSQCAGALAIVLAACTSLPPQDPGDALAAGDLASRCRRAYRAIDDAVGAAGVRDAMAARVAGFPYLRVDRLHGSFAGEPLAPDASAAWLAALQRLDVDARLIEIGNLPPGPTAVVREQLAREGFSGLPPPALLEGCARELAERDLALTARRDAMRTAARVPDDYSEALRAAGLYPLTRQVFAVGVRRHEAETRAAFAVPATDIPLRGTLRQYAPLPMADGAATLRALVREMPRNALGVPQPTPEVLDRLLAGHAPRLLVDERDINDRIGMPVSGEAGGVEVDTRAPVVFTRATATRFDGHVLLQLVYTAWFPARPPQSAGDILAGHMDGLIWRVTLDVDGEPLLFDSIHPCGCYPLFFPTPRLAPKPPATGPDEAALVPQMLPGIAAGTQVVLRIESGTHHLRRVLVEPSATVGARTYAIAPEDRLRHLARSDGTWRSLYGEDGLVAGTERGERLLLWPLGIESAGAMRQWGHHATAFIGKRHFDEAFLLERHFVRAAAGGTAVAAPPE
jgi:hypothetical protein